MKAQILQGKVCGLRTMNGLTPSVQRVGTDTKHSKSKARSCPPPHRWQVHSRRVGSRLALTFCIMDCFDLNFQHFYALTASPRQVGGSRENGLSKLSKTLEKATRLKDDRGDTLSSCNGGKVSVLSSTRKLLIDPGF